jgi:hypothetical protein
MRDVSGNAVLARRGPVTLLVRSQIMRETKRYIGKSEDVYGPSASLYDTGSKLLPFGRGSDADALAVVQSCPDCESIVFGASLVPIVLTILVYSWACRQPGSVCVSDNDVRDEVRLTSDFISRRIGDCFGFWRNDHFHSLRNLQLILTINGSEINYEKSIR